MKEYIVKIDGLSEEWYIKKNFFSKKKLFKLINYYSNGQKKYEFYYLDNKFHRVDGPACQAWYENGQKEYERYFLNGEQVYRTDIIKKTIKIGDKEISEETILLALKNYFK